jgi:hypothetical protein
VKALFAIILFYGFSTILSSQNSYISLDINERTPGYKINEKVSVQITVHPFSVQNLLKHYDADPFEKPVILTSDDLRTEISGSLEKYLSKTGISSDDASENRINLKVELCAINYLFGKGWTSTVKLNLQVNVHNSEVWYGIVGGYSEEGGGEKDINLAGKALNNAFFDAFDSVNWEQLAKSLARDYSSEGRQTDIGLPEDDRGSGLNQQAAISTEEWVPVGRYHALVIAIEDYQYLNKLDQPVKDAGRLIRILTSTYNFSYNDIILLTNPTREEIIDQLDVLVDKVRENDNLLIFYAGHGYWDEERQTGYWLPVDAKKSSTANWLRNTTIQEYIGDIRSKHTLLIADACFGGGIFKTRKAFNDAPVSINRIYELNSRKAMTSGNLNEVPDKSVFFEYLSERLEKNNQKYISSLQLFSSFSTAVMNNSDNVPRYGTIQKAGDEGGDFIFIKK